MKKLLLLFVIALTIILSSSKNSYATHFVGTDLTYTCLGGNTYLITFVFYRDCSGAQAPSSLSISFSCSSNSAFNFNATLVRIPGTGQEITHTCSSVSTYCNNGNNYGVQEYVFQGQVTLANCNSWKISTSSCCRNTVSTINGQLSWNAIAILNNLNGTNSSPSFNNAPEFIVCNNQDININVAGSETDNDSLVYSLYAPFTTYPQHIPYIQPYSGTNFIATSNGITLDSASGQLSFHPTTIQSSVYGIKIEEYRTIGSNTVLVGTIYRDIQIKVINCGGNHIPVLSGLDTSLSKSYSPNDTVYNLEQCLSVDPTVFNIYGFDADTFNPINSGHPEKFTISWNNAIPNATFTPHYNGTDSAYATFSWQANGFDVNKKRCFTATIMDEACAYNALQSFTYCILTKGMLVDIGSDTSICAGESVTLKANTDSTAVNFIWSVDGSSAGIPLSQDSIVLDTNTYGTGLHTVSIETNAGGSSNSCPGVDQVMVDIVYQPHINGVLRDTTICSFQTVTYDAGPGMYFKWTSLISGAYVGYSQTFTTNKDGIYIVRVDGGMNSSCYDIDTFEVIVPPSPPPFSFGPDVTIAQNQTLVLSMPTVQAPHYWWNTGDTTHSITIDSSFNWINKIIGLTTFGNQCYSSDTIYVFIGSVGMEENSDSPLKIYPNPVQSFINIELQKSYSESMVEILDINGKQISKSHFEGKFYKLSSLEALPKGVYILHLQNEELNVLQRFVKK